MAKIQDILSKPFVHLPAIVFITFLIYSNTFHAPFVFDDIPTIVENVSICEPRNYFLPKANRDIGFLTFSINYQLNSLDVFGYHAVNLLIHILNVILVYFLAALTFATPFFKPWIDRNSRHNAAYLAAFLVSGLFAVHPLQTQAVTYIVQRFTSLATLFYLLTFVAYIKARLIIACKSPGYTKEFISKAPSPLPSPARGKGCNISPPLRGGDEGEGDACGFTNDRISKKKKAVPYIFWLFYCSSILFAALAMKTKEIAFTLPAVLAVYEFLFFQEKLKKRGLYLIPLLLTMLIIPLNLLSIDKPIGDVISNVSEVTRDHPDISRWFYLLTQFRVIVTYIRLLILPVNQNLDYDYPVYHSLLYPAVFLSFLFLLSVFVLGIYLYRISRKPEADNRYWHRLAAFGIFWFFIALSVESSVIPIKDMIYEHRVYLPSVGFFMALTAAIAAGTVSWGNRAVYAKRAVVLVMVLAMLALSVATYQRNAVWTDNVRLWEDAVGGSPNKARPHYNLGNAYSEQGRFDEAISEYQIALKLSPDYYNAHHNIGNAYAEQGRFDEAISEYKTALKLNPNFADIYYNLGNAYLKQGRFDEAINEYKTALKLNPYYASAHNNLGATYIRQGRIEEAINEYQIALRLKPDYADAHFNLGNAYLVKGRIDEAINAYRAALKLNPDDIMVRKKLETLLKR